MSDSGYGTPDASQYTHPIATMSDHVNMLVDEKISLKWVEWFGVADSHHLRRRGYTWPPYINNSTWIEKHLQNNPMGIYNVCLLSSYSLQVNYPNVFDKREECGYIEWLLRRMFVVPAGRKTRL